MANGVYMCSCNRCGKTYYADTEAMARVQAACCPCDDD